MRREQKMSAESSRKDFMLVYKNAAER